MVFLTSYQKGAIVAATDAGVSMSYDFGAHWSNYTTADGLGSNTVKRLRYYDTTAMYAATTGGLSVSYPVGGWHNYTTADGLGSNIVNGGAKREG